jgi:hypothetical protein
LGIAAAHHDLKIDPIQEGSRESSPIPPPFRFTAAAGTVRVPPPTAGAGVGGAHQGDAARETATLSGAADPYLSFLERLAQLIENGPPEFSQLIEEQHPVVSQAQLPRPGQPATADEGGG